MFAHNTKKLITFTIISANLSFGALYAGAQEKYGFGRSVHADEISRYDSDIHTDGTGLPTGSGNVALGRDLFEYQCALCHGENLEGVPAMGANSMHEGRRDIKNFLMRHHFLISCAAPCP